MYIQNKYLPLEQKLYQSSSAMQYAAKIEQKVNLNYNNLITKETKSEYSTKKPEYEKLQDINQKEQLLHDSFLIPTRPTAQFIGNFEEIQPLILEAFNKLTNSNLPANIVITLCKAEELENIHKQITKGEWSRGIQGFAINNQIINRIFVKENPLDLLMLTIGHEIGHVLSAHLGDSVKEEAKAFAFEMAWAKTLVENNIGGLKNSINPFPEPAKNGIHDKAFEIVLEKIRKGKQPLEVYEEIIKSSMELADIIGKEIYGAKI